MHPGASYKCYLLATCRPERANLHRLTNFPTLEIVSNHCELDAIIVHLNIIETHQTPQATRTHSCYTHQGCYTHTRAQLKVNALIS